MEIYSIIYSCKTLHLPSRIFWLQDQIRSSRGKTSTIKMFCFYTFKKVVTLLAILPVCMILQCCKHSKTAHNHLHNQNVTFQFSTITQEHLPLVYVFNVCDSLFRANNKQFMTSPLKRFSWSLPKFIVVLTGICKNTILTGAVILLI